MRTLIFRAMAPWITSLMLMLSVFVLLRGHNEPGGGFIGGLIAVAAFAIHGLAFGPPAMRRALRLQPIGIAAIGLVIAAASGLASALTDVPFMTGIWGAIPVLGAHIDVSTVMVFDIGVYLVVLGSITAVTLALEGEEAL